MEGKWSRRIWDLVEWTKVHGNREKPWTGEQYCSVAWEQMTVPTGFCHTLLHSWSSSLEEVQLHGHWQHWDFLLFCFTRATLSTGQTQDRSMFLQKLAISWHSGKNLKSAFQTSCHHWCCILGQWQPWVVRKYSDISHVCNHCEILVLLLQTYTDPTSFPPLTLLGKQRSRLRQRSISRARRKECKTATQQSLQAVADKIQNTSRLSHASSELSRDLMAQEEACKRRYAPNRHAIKESATRHEGHTQKWTHTRAALSSSYGHNL